MFCDCKGFSIAGGFLGLASKEQHGSTASVNSACSDMHVYEDGRLEETQYDEEYFHNMLDHVGAREVFDE